MIRWTRTVNIAVAKNQEVIQWAFELKEYLNSVIEQKGDTKIFIEPFGEPGKICWMADFENLADLESTAKILASDPGYQERLKALEGLILPGTIDKVFRAIG